MCETEQDKPIYDLVERLDVYGHDRLYLKVRKLKAIKEIEDWSFLFTLNEWQEEEEKAFEVPPICNFNSATGVTNFLYATTRHIKNELVQTRNLFVDKNNVPPNNLIEPIVSAEKQMLFLRGCAEINQFAARFGEDPVASPLGRLIKNLAEVDRIIRNMLQLTVYNWKVIQPVGESPMNLSGIWARRQGDQVQLGIAYQFIKGKSMTDEQLIQSLEANELS